jgi:hypothetical protein
MIVGLEIWSEERDGQPSILETVLKKLVGVVRTNNGRTENTSFLVLDAQSVKNTDTAREKGTTLARRYPA